MSLRFLVVYLLFATLCFALERKSVEFKATKAKIRFQKGQDCMHAGESKADCKFYAEGESSCDILRGDRCGFEFKTTDNKGWEPLTVSGAIGALYLHNVSETKIAVSGLVNSYSPTWLTQALTGTAGRPMRIYYHESRGASSLDYEWLEYTIFGEYDPTFKTPPRPSRPPPGGDKDNDSKKEDL